MAEEIKEVKDKQTLVSGELADSELENVSGGLKIKIPGGGKAVMVSRHTHCFTGEYKCAYRYYENHYGDKFMDKGTCTRDNSDGKLELRKFWAQCCLYGTAQCGSCYYLEFKGSTGYCGKSKQ